MNTRDVWLSIRAHDGSVQHLEGLTVEERSVFRKFDEIDQEELIRQNAERQRFVDQGISFNLKIPNNTSVKEINRLHILAWKL